MDTTTKGRLGWSAAKTAVQNPGLVWVTVKSGAKTVPPIASLSFKIGQPLAKRKSQSRWEQIVEQTTETLGELGEAIVALPERLPQRSTPSRLEQIGETLAELGEAIFAIGEVVGELMAAYGPLAARQLGWAEAPKEKRTAPRVAAGAVIGAGAVYFLEPKGGPERREQVLRLVGSAPAQTADGPAQAADGPAQATDGPAQTAGGPAQTAGGPAQTANTPAQPT